jgi:hypothetical protein
MPATVRRRIAAVRANHIAAGPEVPDTRDASAVVCGSQRSCHKPSAAKAALTVGQLREIPALLLAAGCSKLHFRDRTLVVFGFATGMRRS